ncbi:MULTISPECIES: PfkB family carbohydrate kinase [Enterococcus]|uniref:PfkB family carbohydrate kinase n=1 Tax=Enterococcus TaxID=1350 RepID=UPI0022E1CC4E|nr:PfkB family carbohydrate kinase [Enterococcus thailandicus]
MKKVIALADNCIDVYPELHKFYLTGNSIDFALNYRAQGGNVTVMTVLGNDLFAEALESLLAYKDIPLKIIERINRPTAMAKMDLIDNDKVHLAFHGNAMEEMHLDSHSLAALSEYDIVYVERWSKAHEFIAAIRKPDQTWIYDFSKRLDQEINKLLLPYLDIAFFSYDHNDDWIRDYLKRAHEQGCGTVIAMLGPEGSLAYDGKEFFYEVAEKVPVVNTVGAGDSYISAFTYGISLGESITECMARGKKTATKIIQQFLPY